MCIVSLPLLQLAQTSCRFLNDIIGVCTVLYRPQDVFFMLQLGPYWMVSHDSHSTQHPAWNWGLQLPVPDTDAVINLVVRRGEEATDIAAMHVMGLEF